MSLSSISPPFNLFTIAAFSADLTGSAIRPDPVNTTTANGSASFTYNPATGLVLEFGY